MIKKRLRFLPIVILASLAVFYIIRYKTTPALDLAELKISHSDGSEWVLSDSIKYPALIHMYASWCGPCLAELENMYPVKNEFSNAGVQLYLLSDDSHNVINQFADRYSGLGKFLRIPSFKEIGVYSIPISYLLDKDGNIIWKNSGPANWDSAEMKQLVTQ